MYVEVRGDRADVRDADNCRALDIRVRRADRPHVDQALRAAGLGSWDGGTEAELTVAGLHAAASGGQIGSDWQHRWDDMVAYAAAKGWLTADGSGVRAHLVELY
jgi:hypothetical protein